MKFNKKLLIYCILIATIISIGQYLGYSPIVLIGIILFLGLIVLAPISYKFAIMLFFLPWSGIMKLSPNSNSFFTVALLIFTFILLVKQFKVRMISLIIILLLFIYTLVVKASLGDSISLRFVIIFVFLLMVSLVINNEKKLINFHFITTFFVLGTILANGVSMLLIEETHLIGYFKDSYAFETFRYCGFNGDPNRNATQILVVMSCLLMIDDKSLNPINKFYKYGSLLLLTYFGFISLSKMFFLLLICLLLFWFITLLIENKNLKYKITMLFFIGITFGTLTKLNIFGSQIYLIIDRFGEAQNLNSITTGRYNFQVEYLDFIKENVLVFLFGAGLETNNLVNGHAAHNTFLQILYQLGLIGSMIFVLWLLSVFIIKRNPISLNVSKYFYIFLLLITIIGSSFSLDFLSIDAFYYYMIIVIASINYKTSN
jgi:hypothetical protein